MIARIVDNNVIEVYDTSQFDIYAIMHSGQVFRYFEENRAFRLIVGKNQALLRQEGDKVLILSNNSPYFFNYFDLATDYNAIKRELSVFTPLQNAIEVGGGIRILRSEFFEVVISFIISANNNIKRFTRTINELCARFGEPLEGGAFAFPTLERLNEATESDFRELGCGYRSPYLAHAVCQLGLVNLDALERLSSDQLIRALRKIRGVGKKVASCIALFSSLHRLDIAPVDTHIERAISQLGETSQKILTHRYAGVAQQYIFYYLQHLKQTL